MSKPFAVAVAFALLPAFTLEARAQNLEETFRRVSPSVVAFKMSVLRAGKVIELIGVSQ